MKFAPKGVDFLYLSTCIGSPEYPQLKVMQKVSRFFHLLFRTRAEAQKPTRQMERIKHTSKTHATRASPQTMIPIRLELEISALLDTTH